MDNILLILWLLPLAIHILLIIATYLFCDETATLRDGDYTMGIFLWMTIPLFNYIVLIMFSGFYIDDFKDSIK